MAMQWDSVNTIPCPAAQIESERHMLTVSWQAIPPFITEMVLSDHSVQNFERNAQAFDFVITGRMPTAHRLHTVFKGYATAHGWDDKWPEIQLAHVIGDAVQQAYDREQFIEHRRKMMPTWSDFVFSNQSLITKFMVAPVIVNTL